MAFRQYLQYIQKTNTFFYSSMSTWSVKPAYSMSPVLTVYMYTKSTTIAMSLK